MKNTKFACILNEHVLLLCYRLLENIQITPKAPGNVLTYRQNGVTIFCIFFCNSMGVFSDWMEDALNDMKKSLAGHIQLAIQISPTLYDFQPKLHSYLCSLFQTIFTHDTVTLWLCGSF